MAEAAGKNCYNSLMTAKNWTHLHPQYAGKWVALAADETTVVGSGPSIKIAIKTAKKKGLEEPILFRVPQDMYPYAG